MVGSFSVVNCHLQKILKNFSVVVFTDTSYRKIKVVNLNPGVQFFLKLQSAVIRYQG